MKNMKNINAAGKISVSPGNSKMGAIPSVSLPPVVTCAAGCKCAQKCYAAKLCRLRPSVRNAYERNLAILAADPAAYWLQVKAAASVSRFFRFHVSGDIPSPEYLGEMLQVCKDLPGTQFLCFTKRFDLVNKYAAHFGVDFFPANLHLIFSAWPGMPMDNPHNFPVANVIFNGQAPADNWKICGGNCAECACAGVGCWELKSGEHIAFYEH